MPLCLPKAAVLFLLLWKECFPYGNRTINAIHFSLPLDIPLNCLSLWEKSSILNPNLPESSADLIRQKWIAVSVLYPIHPHFGSSNLHLQTNEWSFPSQTFHVYHYISCTTDMINLEIRERKLRKWTQRHVYLSTFAFDPHCVTAPYLCLQLVERCALERFLKTKASN